MGTPSVVPVTILFAWLMARLTLTSTRGLGTIDSSLSIIMDVPIWIPEICPKEKSSCRSDDVSESGIREQLKAVTPMYSVMQVQSAWYSRVDW
jgi:hypothetical protein